MLEVFAIIFCASYAGLHCLAARLSFDANVRHDKEIERRKNEEDRRHKELMDIVANRHLSSNN
jgi:hypothetical protein